ncbi:MAG TPA: AAA family ATPase [Methanobacteriaceae archaeon]|nr:AAA family ATPase [Methanobacteriaceae archaeon]
MIKRQYYKIDTIICLFLFPFFKPVALYMSNNLFLPTIYFKSLELKNIRCFSGEQTLDLTNGDDNPAQWTLILGNNGVGKTTLLQCLAWMTPVPKVDDKNNTVGIIPAISDAENADFEKLLRNNPEGDSSLCANLTHRIPLTELNLNTKPAFNIFTKCTFSGKEDGDLNKVSSNGSEDNELYKDTSNGSEGKHELPLVIAYGANRQQAISYQDKNYASEDAAKILTGTTKLIDVEDLLNDIHHAAVIEGREGEAEKRLSTVKKILSEILPDLSGEDPIKIYGPKLPGSKGPSGVRCITPYSEVPISALSLGYRTTMGWIVDLAWRLYTKYPKSKNPLSEPAIVLIDEIDLHLHPLWQRKIITDISVHFPNTQFIATAHSPLMVQSADKANLVVLITEDNHVRIENNPEFIKGWRVDQILTSDLFGISSARSEAVENSINERYELLKIERNVDQEQRLKELDKEIQDLPTLSAVKDREVLDFIKRAAEAINK